MHHRWGKCYCFFFYLSSGIRKRYFWLNIAFNSSKLWSLMPQWIDISGCDESQRPHQCKYGHWLTSDPSKYNTRNDRGLWERVRVCAKVYVCTWIIFEAYHIDTVGCVRHDPSHCQYIFYLCVTDWPYTGLLKIRVALARRVKESHVHTCSSLALQLHLCSLENRKLTLNHAEKEVPFKEVRRKKWKVTPCCCCRARSWKTPPAYFCLLEPIFLRPFTKRSPQSNKRTALRFPLRIYHFLLAGCQ